MSKASEWGAQLEQALWREAQVRRERPSVTPDGVYIEEVGWVRLEVDDSGCPVFVIPGRDTELGHEIKRRYVVDQTNIARLLKACRAILDTFGDDARETA